MPSYSETLQTHIAAFTFGVLLHYAITTKLAFAGGYGKEIIRPQHRRRFNLVLFLLFASLWTKLAFLNFAMPSPTACQATTVLSAVVDQAARTAAAVFLLARLSTPRSRIDRYIFAALMVVRVGLAIMFAAFTRPQFAPLCIPRMSMIELPLTILVVDVATLLLVVVREIQRGAWSEAWYAPPSTRQEQTRAGIFFVGGYFCWNILSIPFLLGIGKVAFFVRTGLPCIGLFVFIAMLNYYQGALVTEIEESPPSSPTSKTFPPPRSLDSPGSGAFPRSSYAAHIPRKFQQVMDAKTSNTSAPLVWTRDLGAHPPRSSSYHIETTKGTQPTATVSTASEGNITRDSARPGITNPLRMNKVLPPLRTSIGRSNSTKGVIEESPIVPPHIFADARRARNSQYLAAMLQNGQTPVAQQPSVTVSQHEQGSRLTNLRTEHNTTTRPASLVSMPISRASSRNDRKTLSMVSPISMSPSSSFRESRPSTASTNPFDRSLSRSRSRRKGAGLNGTSTAMLFNISENVRPESGDIQVCFVKDIVYDDPSRVQTLLQQSVKDSATSIKRKPLFSAKIGTVPTPPKEVYESVLNRSRGVARAAPRSIFPREELPASPKRDKRSPAIEQADEEETMNDTPTADGSSAELIAPSAQSETVRSSCPDLSASSTLSGVDLPVAPRPASALPEAAQSTVATQPSQSDDTPSASSHLPVSTSTCEELPLKEAITSSAFEVSPLPEVVVIESEATENSPTKSEPRRSPRIEASVRVFDTLSGIQAIRDGTNAQAGDPSWHLQRDNMAQSLLQRRKCRKENALSRSVSVLTGAVQSQVRNMEDRVSTVGRSVSQPLQPPRSNAHKRRSGLAGSGTSPSYLVSVALWEMPPTRDLDAAGLWIKSEAIRPQAQLHHSPAAMRSTIAGRRPITFHSAACASITSTSLWKKPCAIGPSRAGLWSTSPPRPQRSTSLLSIPKLRRKRLRRSKPLPGIIESPRPLPGKEESLGFFQLPGGPSDSARHQSFRDIIQLERTRRAELMKERLSVYTSAGGEVDGGTRDDDFDESTLWEIASILQAR
ncbi:MAG: hypothetical protein M1817_000783 [Caeruleum heppii]|nr:MAG: hypothetical protein M1817_000783 [Caeruleum heppii]